MATRLIPQLAPFPPGFRGNLNKFAKAFVDRLVILQPDNGLQWQIGGLQPTSNVGPWLKDGLQPFVWSEDLKTYIPMDLSASLTSPFFFGPSTPLTQTPPLWFQTTASGGFFNVYNTTLAAWIPATGPMNSGPTASRPTLPVNLEPFWDTTINAAIHFERGQWRTISGSPGDVKFVNVPGADFAAVVTEAQARSPGWSAVSVDFNGRSPMFAGAGFGLTPRAPLASFGDEAVTINATHIPPLYTGTTNQLLGFGLPGSGTLQITAGGAANVSVGPILEGGGLPHPNLGPTIALVGLQKT
jgi:hypothetical protein